MGFKAQEAVVPLDWDFRPHVDAHGTTPEPTNEQIMRFVSRFRGRVDAVRRKALAKLQEEQELAKGRSEEELDAERARWATIDWPEGLALIEAELKSDEQVEQGEELAKQLAVDVEKLTNGCPSAEQIMQLPGRIRAAYFGWIVGQLTNPESWAADTNSSQALELGGSLGTSPVGT